MKEKNTKQKELILEILKSTKSHPNIYELYDMVSKKDPSVGMATVYRNIKKFVQDGTIQVIKTKDGCNHYDFYNRHIHFECLNCGILYDIYDEKILKMLDKRLKTTGAKHLNIRNYNITVDGYCEKCQKISPLENFDNDN